MDSVVEQVKTILEGDLKDCPYTLNDPLGHACTYRKIRDYMFACIKNGVQKPDCVDWLYKLYKGQTDEEHSAFQTRIDLSANLLYDFYKTLKND